MEITRLRVENREHPIGIDKRTPVFSWNIKTKEKDFFQEDYRILVKSGQTLLWDSQVVEERTMLQIPYEGLPLCADTRYEWQVSCHGTNGEAAVSEWAWFETGLFSGEDWSGIYIGETKDHSFHLFRRQFETKGEVIRARLYICGLGHHVCEVNGSPVTGHVLEPGWSDYDRTCFYNTYDVTGLLLQGDNAIGIKLGDGMYNLPGGRYVYYERSYGKMKCNVELRLTFADFTTQTIATDTDWKMAKSPITFCCMYGGEDYDARLEKKNFSRPDYIEDGEWEPVTEVEPPRGAVVSAPTHPLTVMERYEPVAITAIEKNTYSIDFGTNFSGWVRMRIEKNGAPAGTKIRLVPGEILDADGRPDQRVTGRDYAWTYILNEEEGQEFAPDFTYTGFRYVQVEGALCGGEHAQGVPRITAMTGEFIYPDTTEDGSFICSNPLFNQIHHMIRQAVLSNMKSYLTDCPHRERLPWLEQTHLIAPGVMYNFDVQNLYEKQEQDMKDAQHADGLVPDIAPEYVKFGYHKGFVDSPEWGSACIINPWYLYKRYGDTATMGRYYDTMKKYLDHLTSMTHHHMLHHGLGDWLDIGPNTPWSQNTPVPVVASAIYYYDICIMEKIAAMLKKTEDAKTYARLRNEVFEEFNRQYFDEQTARYATGSQAAQAMALVTGLVPSAYHERVVEVLRKDIENRSYAITAGDVGHPFLITAAIHEGLNDLIYRMTLETETPGYGYQLANGATTLTEEWDGPDRENRHGSQNHFMLGGIEEWFYSALGGIRLLHDDSSFGAVRICPYVPSDMEFCRVSLRHPYGMIKSEWKNEPEAVCFSFEIPPNLKAQLVIGGEIYTVGSGSFRYELAK